MERITTKVYKRGTFKISQDELYTYVNYSPEGSTIVSSCMYLHDSYEKLEFSNGDLIVSEDAKKYFEDRGFEKVYSVEYIEANNHYKIKCEAVCPLYNTPEIIRIDSELRDAITMESCVCAYVCTYNRRIN